MSVGINYLTQRKQTSRSLLMADAMRQCRCIMFSRTSAPPSVTGSVQIILRRKSTLVLVYRTPSSAGNSLKTSYTGISTRFFCRCSGYVVFRDELYCGTYPVTTTQTTFYATESSVFRNRIIYFRQDDWQTLCEPLLKRLASVTFKEMDPVRIRFASPI